MKGRPNWFIAALLTMLPWALWGASVSAQRTASDGVYADPQAARGQQLYGQQCSSCHGSDLMGSGAPALAGAEFLDVWGAKPLAELVEKIAVSMPSSAPGSLSREQATDLVAFMLKSNNFPSGAADLDSDAATLATITFK